MEAASYAASHTLTEFELKRVKTKKGAKSMKEILEECCKPTEK
jgi:hypothetical protein